MRRVHWFNTHLRKRWTNIVSYDCMEMKFDLPKAKSWMGRNSISYVMARVGLSLPRVKDVGMLVRLSARKESVFGRVAERVSLSHLDVPQPAFRSFFAALCTAKCNASPFHNSLYTKLPRSLAVTAIVQYNCPGN